MENNKTYTVAEVLDITIRALYAINVPIELINQIGMPISQCIGNLKLLQQAMTVQQASEQETEVPNEEPEEEPEN